MLKVVGNVYSDTKENLQKMVKVLTDNGFEIALSTGIGVVVMEEMIEEEEENEFA